MVDWIIENHDRKTRHRQFGAIMAVSSVDSVLSYYDAFEACRQVTAGWHCGGGHEHQARHHFKSVAIE